MANAGGSSSNGTLLAAASAPASEAVAEDSCETSAMHICSCAGSSRSAGDVSVSSRPTHEDSCRAGGAGRLAEGSSRSACSYIDLELLADLLSLHEHGARVTWPSGWDARLAAEAMAQRVAHS